MKSKADKPKPYDSLWPLCQERGFIWAGTARSVYIGTPCSNYALIKTVS